MSSVKPITHMGQLDTFIRRGDRLRRHLRHRLR